MEKKLIISRLYNIATIVHKNQIQEFMVVHNDYQVGDIYIGVINKIFQSINAAFVSLQSNKKNGFIHANDSSSLKRKSNIINITKIFTVNQKVLVQIIKESTLRKGPKLTANVTLPGQYITLMPLNNAICIARNITSSKARCTLKALAILLKPFEMGLLFHQCSVGIDENILITELEILKKQWNFIKKSTVYEIHPSLIYRNNNIVKKVLQEFYMPCIKKVLVDSDQGISKLKKYLQSNSYYSKLLNSTLQLLKESRYFLGNAGIFLKIIKELQNCKQLPLGGYITIETSEALTTIDVNSGSFNNSSNPRETALATNCIAATEIGYQLRKQNITGMIIIDFIDMRRQHDQLQLLIYFSEELKQDEAQPQIIQLSELGLVEIIRQRTNKNLQELYHEYLLPKINQHYLAPKPIEYDSNFNYSLSKMIHQASNTNIATVKNVESSIFFKQVFSAFFHLIYKRKNVCHLANTNKNNPLFNISVIYLPLYSWNITSKSLYKSAINNGLDI